MMKTDILEDKKLGLFLDESDDDGVEEEYEEDEDGEDWDEDEEGDY